MATTTTPKDNIIDDMGDRFGLELTDVEHDRLRRLTESELMFVVVLLGRAIKHASQAEFDMDDESLAVFEATRHGRARATAAAMNEEPDDEDPPTA